MLPLDSCKVRVSAGVLQVRLPDGFSIHARPAVLIARVVAHHRTPVELEVGGRRCDPAAILQLLITLGSAPDANELVFRGGERVLGDLETLFRHELGERGIDGLPDSLDYLRSLEEWCRD